MKKRTRYRYKRVFAYNEVITLAIPLILILLFWSSPLLYVFKLFVVLVHEYSHAFAALATGGEIISIHISRELGGYAKTLGGINFIIVSAGYLGSLLFGIALLSLSKIKRINRLLLILLLILMFSLTFLYVTGVFAILYNLAFMAILIVLIFFGNSIRYYFLRFLGLLTMLYAFYDIKSDLFFNNARNDAVILEGITGVPSVIWSVLWAVLSLVFLYYLFLTKIEKEEIFED